MADNRVWKEVGADAGVVETNVARERGVSSFLRNMKYANTREKKLALCREKTLLGAGWVGADR